MSEIDQLVESETENTMGDSKGTGESGPAPIILALRGSPEYLEWLKALKSKAKAHSLNDLAETAFRALAKSKGHKGPPERIGKRQY